MVDYLRLSITDRCNLRCTYCAPLKGKEFLTHDEVLRYEEMERLVRIFVKAGIRKVRITGGEPLIKKNILDLVKMLRGIEALEEISLTTNGVKLKGMAVLLREAGIDRINISLDTLRKERFEAITGFDCFEDVWNGVVEALESGFHSVKLNVVPLNTFNDDEILDFANLTVNYPLIVRFIEIFSTNKSADNYIPLRLLNERVEEKINSHYGIMTPVSGILGNGPSEYYKIDNAKGSIGFISNFSRHFCEECSRLRLDCSGKISPCLFCGPVYDTKVLLRSRNQEKQLFEDIKKIISQKKNYTKKTCKKFSIEMSSIGG